MQATCSCRTLPVGSVRLQPVALQRTTPFAPRLHLALGSCQSRRGVALQSRLVAARPSVNTPALTTCKAAAPPSKPEVPSAVAHLRYSRGSPSKVRRILDNIRGRPYEEALGILEYAPYRACEPLLKLLISAAANAKNKGLKKVKLYISECYCDEGPILKRIKTRAKGRADKIAKLTNHISIRVAERPVES